MTETPDPAAAAGPHEGYHLAQVNIGRLTGPLDAPHMADFTDNLARVNDLAKASPGFVWVLEGDDPVLGATDVVWPGEPDTLVNMSVWESVTALRDFAFSGDHRGLLARRREFFEKPTDAISVMWWIPAGTVPTVREAHERLERFRKEGATAYGFSFTKLYTPGELAALD